MSIKSSPVKKYQKYADEWVNEDLERAAKMDWTSDVSVEMIKSVLLEKGHYTDKKAMDHARQVCKRYATAPVVLPSNFTRENEGTEPVTIAETQPHVIAETQPVVSKEVSKESSDNNDVSMDDKSKESESDGPEKKEKDRIDVTVDKFASQILKKINVWAEKASENLDFSSLEIKWMLGKALQRTTRDIALEHKKQVEAYKLAKASASKGTKKTMEEFKKTYQPWVSVCTEFRKVDPMSADASTMDALIQKRDTIVNQIPAAYEQYCKEYDAPDDAVETHASKCLQLVLPFPGRKKTTSGKKRARSDSDSEKSSEEVKMEEYKNKDGDEWATKEDIERVRAIVDQDKTLDQHKLGVTNATLCPCQCSDCQNNPKVRGQYMHNAYHCDSYCIKSKMILMWKSGNGFESKTDMDVWNWYATRKQSNGPGFHLDKKLHEELMNQMRSSCDAPPQVLTNMHLCQYEMMGKLIPSAKKKELIQDESYLAIFGVPPPTDDDDDDDMSVVGYNFVIMPLVHVNSSIVKNMRDAYGMELLTTFIPASRVNKQVLFSMFGNKDKMIYGEDHSIFIPDSRSKTALLKKFTEYKWYEKISGFPTEDECNKMSWQQLKILDQDVTLQEKRQQQGMTLDTPSNSGQSKKAKITVVA